MTKKRSLLRASREWIIDALLLQTLLTFASLPFLLWWGIPYPLLSLVGNLIHPFFLTLFLSNASVLFCAVLFKLPHALLAASLETLTGIWHALLTAPVPAGWVVLSWWHIAPLGVVCFFLYTGRYQPKKRFPLFLKPVLLTIASVSTLAGVVAAREPGTTVISRGDNSLICIPHNDGTLEIIDNGLIARTANIPALVTYEIMPHVLTTYGSFKKVKLAATGRRTREALALIKQWNPRCF